MKILQKSPYRIAGAMLAAVILSFLTPAEANAAGSLTFSATSLKVIDVTPDASTGLDKIFVVNNADGVTASYTASGSADSVKWLRFSAMGGAYAEEVESTNAGNVSSVQLGQSDMGYIVEEGTRRSYFWIVNYANHPLEIRSIRLSPESDCMSATLSVDGEGNAIRYYAITGAPKTLGREITVEYSTLEYDETTAAYKQVKTSKTYDELASHIYVAQPLCDTRFTIAGDRFTTAWGNRQTAETEWYQTIAVDAHTTAEQTLREVDNESKVDGAEGTLGGSAPVDITFTAAVTDAVRFTEWQISQTPDFSSIDLRYNQTDLDYTFREYGNYYVRFVAANSDGSCESVSPTYEIGIGESRLLCPNAFSPGASEGVNDEWKVSYRSIVEFECHIFNRWGVKMATLTDPSQGWDGRYNGKLVSSGVYYYVIKAVGADGRKYDLSGDINIIRYTYNGTSSGTDDPVVSE